MSAKSVIQKLQDSELIRLFLQFVQKFQLQYQKTSKQISYKCYEATWVLVSFKANGYGRTQSEAFKHALRNLLQVLIQEPEYTQFFVQALTVSNYKNRPSVKKNVTNQTHDNYAKKIVSIKTQGYEYVEKQSKAKGDIYPKIYESYSKSNQRSQAKFVGKLEQTYQPNFNDPGQAYQTVIPKNQSIQAPKRSLNSSSQSKYPCSSYSSKFQNPNDQQSCQNLKKALRKLSELEEYLAAVSNQNESLKKELCHINENQYVQQKQNTFAVDQKQNLGHDQMNNQTDFSTFMKNKPMIPKLKLDILPNYHKKSQKSLNQSLLAAYNDKRDPSVKKLIC